MGSKAARAPPRVRTRRRPPTQAAASLNAVPLRETSQGLKAIIRSHVACVCGQGKVFERGWVGLGGVRWLSGRSPSVPAEGFPSPGGMRCPAPGEVPLRPQRWMRATRVSLANLTPRRPPIIRLSFSTSVGLPWRMITSRQLE